jgi:hypothetical protein
MSNEAVILFPPTHEQSLPTFHVREDLRSKFVEFLAEEGFQLGEPPEHLTGTAVTEVLVEAGTPLDKLNATREKFLALIRES